MATPTYALIVAPAALLAVGAALLLTTAGPADGSERIGELERARAGVPSAAAEAAQPASFPVSFEAAR